MTWAHERYHAALRGVERPGLVGGEQDGQVVADSDDGSSASLRHADSSPRNASL